MQTTFALHKSARTHLKNKTLKLDSTARKVGMNIGIKNTKLTRIGESPNQTIKIDGQEIETVDRFTYLGSIVDVNGGTDAVLKKQGMHLPYLTHLEISKDKVKNKDKTFQHQHQIMFQENTRGQRGPLRALARICPCH